MLGEKIKLLRKSKGLTQAELGALIGVRQTSVAMYEAGHLTPPTKRIAKLAHALGAHPGDLLDFVQDIAPNPN